MEHIKESLSQLSIQSADSPNEDWDRSMQEDADPTTGTPRNSIAFPGATNGDDEGIPLVAGGKAKRTLSELLKVHAEKGTDVTFTPEEASRLADVLGQWINSGASPYESEDDFFTRTLSQDDSSLPGGKRSVSGASFDISGRPRGQSESVVKPAS